MGEQAFVKISREEFEMLGRRISALEAVESKFASERASLINENAFLKEEIRLLRHKLFGHQSEKWQPPEGTVSLFDEVEEVAEKPAPAVEEKITVGPHERTKKPRGDFPADMPRIEVVHDLAEDQKICPTDGTRLVTFGEEVSSKLDIIPATIQVIDNIRLKYKCPCCNDYVVTARIAPQAIPKSIASEGLLAHIAAAKYQNGLPLHRQEGIFREIGCDLSRNVMAKWMIQCSELVAPLTEHLKDLLLSMSVLHADETPVQVLKQPGKKPGSQGTMWVLASGMDAQPAVYFEFQTSRSSQAAFEVIGNYEGYLHIDGYDGYNRLFISKKATRVGCVAHARRKFSEAVKAGSAQGGSLGENALEYFSRLYEIEKRIRSEGASVRKTVRSEESVPILREFRTWAEKSMALVPPKSKIGVAFSYLINEWEHLVRYTENGHLSIDNNRAENAIRPFAVGRKNWLFSDTTRGASASARLYSLIESAKLNGISPYGYLKYVFAALARRRDGDDSIELGDLLPWNANLNSK